MKVKNDKCCGVDGYFEFTYKDDYFVIIECFVGEEPEATVQFEGLLLDTPYMTDDKGEYIKTIESILQWIDEDIRLKEEEATNG